MLPPQARRRRAWIALAVGAVFAPLVSFRALAPGEATASSHREAPWTAGQPQYDNTDLYAFVSPDRPDSVTLVANWIPFQEPAGGPNFYPFATDARYDINIDNDGDARADLTYRWTFDSEFRNKDTFLYNTGPVESLDDEDLNFRQTYRLEELRFSHDGSSRRTVLTHDGPVAPSNVGEPSMPDYEKLRDQAIESLHGDIKAFAGQAEDPFFLDLRVFDLLYGGDLSEVGNDTLAGYNVNSVALQVPIEKLTSDDDPVVGVWSTTSRQNSRGQWVQVSRLGMPLVNEVVIPVRDKDRFNASKPSGDARFLEHVVDPEVPKLIEQIYDIEAPDTPRKDLVEVFLTGVKDLNQPDRVTPSEQLRLNTHIDPAEDPKRLGVLDGDKAGFPNGRRLTDDVIDIVLQVAEGELLGTKNDLGDAVDKNDASFEEEFPYLALPVSGSVTRSKGGDQAEPGGPAPSPAAARGAGAMGTAMPYGAVAVGVAVLGAGVWWAMRRRRTGGSDPFRSF